MSDEKQKALLKTEFISIQQEIAQLRNTLAQCAKDKKEIGEFELCLSPLDFYSFTAQKVSESLDYPL